MNKLAQLLFDDTKQVCLKLDPKELFGKTILITGASGLIGTYLLAVLKRFSQDNPGKIKVVAVSHTGFLPYQRFFLDDPHSISLTGDLTDHDFCQTLPQADIIIHAAGYAQPGRFMADPTTTIKLNTVSTFALFDKLLPGGKFLFVSTSEIYSGSPHIPYQETDKGTTDFSHPRSCYIESKRCGEAICSAFRSQGVDAKWVRLSLAYGPGTRPNDQRVMNSFIQKGIIEKQITLLDRGEAKRTYCYISDAIEIMWLVLFRGTDVVYNGGGQSKISIGELAQSIGAYLHVPVHFPADSSKEVKGAPEDVWLDMSKVIQEFNKKEYISLDDGLRRTIEWQKELYAHT